MSHTKAPWFLELDQFRDTLYVTAEARDGYIPICNLGIGYEGDIEVEQQANAKLIAAAPDLLAAGERILRKLESEYEGVNMLDQIELEKAIAKAKS